MGNLEGTVTAPVRDRRQYPGAWQTLSGKDANSVSADPVFTSATDLHPTAPAPNNAGIAISGVTTDFAGTTRSNPPDIGAYEYTLAVASINTLDATAIGETTATLNGNINTNNEIVTVSFEYGPDTVYGSSIAAVPSPVKSVTLHSRKREPHRTDAILDGPFPP